MIVTNISDELITDAARENWLKYWKHFSNNNYEFCSEVNCTSEHKHGVLVKQDQHKNNRLFVVPLCREHSYDFKRQLIIDEKVEIVSAELSL